MIQQSENRVVKDFGWCGYEFGTASALLLVCRTFSFS